MLSSTIRWNSTQLAQGTGGYNCFWEPPHCLLGKTLTFTVSGTSGVNLLGTRGPSKRTNGTGSNYYIMCCFVLLFYFNSILFFFLTAYASQYTASPHMRDNRDCDNMHWPEITFTDSLPILSGKAPTSIIKSKSRLHTGQSKFQSLYLRVVSKGKCIKVGLVCLSLSLETKIT